jgi:hypothetical protein
MIPALKRWAMIKGEEIGSNDFASFVTFCLDPGLEVGH